MPRVRRGEVFPWSSMCPPPEGYRFLPHRALLFVDQPLPIVALRDHEDPPVMGEEYLRKLENRVDRQAGLLNRRPS